MINPLLLTDSYKVAHQEQYCPGTTKVYSYLMTRSDKEFKNVSFVGLQYYLKQYLSIKLTPEMGEEFIETQTAVIGNCSDLIKKNIRALCKLGYFPLEIKAVEEGTVLPTKNVVLTITNTLPEFYWVPGFVESLLLKVWYSCSVASCSLNYREMVEKYFNLTVDEDMYGLKMFQSHDFGYRGSDTEESAAISGFAHLTNFLGSDTISARKFSKEFYGAIEPIMLSVPASEHSTACSFGRTNELDFFRHMLKTYPTGIVSIISDTWNLWNVLTNIAVELKDEILAREGKVVFRPDSGNPELIINGDPNAPEDSPENLGAIRLLDKLFGSTINSKGYKVLLPSVGLIYGDAIYRERYERILARMMEQGYAASNLVIGVGGIMRNFTRDSLGMALKATYVEVNGEQREIEKDPITDQKKKSHKGLIQLIRNNNGVYETRDRVTWEEEKQGELKTVFLNGKITKEFTLSEIRERVNEYFLNS